MVDSPGKGRLLGHRIFSIALLTISLAGCGAPAPKEAAADEPAPVSVEMAVVERRDMPDTLAVDGTLVTPEGASARLAPAVAGKLVDLSVKEGDPVVAGQLLGHIDIRSLIAQSQSAAAGAASASATASQTALALKAAQADQVSAVRAAQLALEVAIDDGQSQVDTAIADLRRLQAGPRPQELAQSQQAVDQARISRDKARLDADRDARLFKEGLVAGSQADTSAAALQSAESVLKSAQAAFDLVKAGSRPSEIQAGDVRLKATRQLAEKKIEQARAALAQAQSGHLAVAAKGQELTAAQLAAAQKAADSRAASAGIAAGELRSPITGYVTKRLLNVGDIADPANPVLTISATRPNVDFVGNLSPTEAQRVVRGMRITLANLSGIVVSIGGSDPATGLVPIRARLAGSTRAGGFATAQIVLATLRGVAAVPKGAVLSRDGGDVVFVAKEGTAHLTKVTLGPEQGGLVAVRAGVSPGQSVVVLGGHELSDGAKVEAAKAK